MADVLFSTSATRAGVTIIALVTMHHPVVLRAAGASLVVGDFADPGLHDVLKQSAMLRNTPIKSPDHLP